MHCDFGKPGVWAIDKHSRQTLVDIYELLGSVGTLEERTIDKQEKLLNGRWV